MINNEIFKHVLTVGTDDRNHRGGIGAVIGGYRRYFTPFIFLPSHKATNKGGVILYSCFSIARIFFYLLFHPKIKIVHLHGASNGSFYRKYIIYLISKYIFKKKIIYHVHGGAFQSFFSHSSKLTRVLVRHFLNGADSIVCLTNALGKFFQSSFNPKKLFILPNFVELPEASFTPHQLKPRVVFLFLGKIVSEKGIFDLLEVIKELVHFEDVDFELLIGGDGETQKLKKIIYENGLGGYVKFYGWVAGLDKEALLSNADIYILPSYFESFPVSILEAMSYNMPIISTVVGGIPQLVKNNRNGFLIEPGDKDSLKKAMKFFIEDRSKIDLFGGVSKILVTEYQPHRVLSQLIEIYITVLHGNNCKPSI